MSNEKQKVSAAIAKKLTALKKIHAELDALDDKRRVLLQKCDLMQVEIVQNQTGLKIGDIIVWSNRKLKGRVLKLWTYYERGLPDLNRITVTRILKDGSDGKMCQVYRFEKWEKVQP